MERRALYGLSVMVVFALVIFYPRVDAGMYGDGQDFSGWKGTEISGGSVSSPASTEAGKPPREDLDYGWGEEQVEPGGEWVGENVNILMGNVLETVTDVQVPSPNRFGLIFKRSYNSRRDASGSCGYGWTHTYLMSLHLPGGAEPYLRIIDSTGRGHYFSESSPGFFEGVFLERSTVQLRGNGIYAWASLDGNVYGFNAAGRLSWIDDPAGNRINVGYTANGKPWQISDTASGRSLTLGYNTAGLLETVTGPIPGTTQTGILATFIYNAQNLTSVTYADGSGWTYEYADPGDVHNLTARRNKMDHLLAGWSYDGSDRCTGHFHRDGLSVGLAYPSGSQVDVTDAYGKARSYTISPFGALRRVTALAGPSNAPYARSNAVRWVYDERARLTEVRMGGGRIDRFADFDDAWRPRTVTLAVGKAEERVLKYTYHDRMRAPLTRSEASVLTGGSKVTIWDYDDPLRAGDNPDIPNEAPTRLLHRVIEQGFTRDASGIVPYNETVASITCNALGQILFFDGPIPGNTDTTSFSYDEVNGNLLSITPPLIGQIVLSDHDAAGSPRHITDMNNQVRILTLDPGGRVTEVKYEADGSRSGAQFNPAGLLRAVTDEDNVTRTCTYNPKGQLKEIVDDLGNTIFHLYDTRGNLRERSIFDGSRPPSDPEAKTFVRTFDYMHPTYPGLLWKEIQADETCTRYGYDEAGNVNMVVDPSLNRTFYGYDAFGRMKTETRKGPASDPIPDVITRLTYDGHGNLRSVTDPEGCKTVYIHDDLGRVVEIRSPDAGTSSYVYDPAGNLLQKTDARGLTANFVYDALSRLTTASYPAQGEWSAYVLRFFYDQRANGKGHLTGFADRSGSTALYYNTRGRLFKKVSSIDGLGFVLSRGITPGGRVSKITYPSGRTVEYQRNGDCACLVDALTTRFNGFSVALVSDLAYRPFGEASGMRMGNGTVENRFDLNGWITGANLPAGSSQPTAGTRSFTHDANGRLESVTAPLSIQKAGLRYLNTRMGYDALGRLTELARNFDPAQDLTGPATLLYGYAYDNAGNRQSETVNGKAESYFYFPGTNRLREVQASGASSVAYGFDASGNTTEVSDSSVVRKFYYDPENQLIRVKEGAGVLASYTCNALGERVKKVSGGATIFYLYDFDGSLIAEANQAQSYLSEYLYRGRVRLARANPSTGAIFRYHNDQLGTPLFMTDKTGTVVWEAAYEPFGQAYVHTSSTQSNNFRFQGMYHDVETGNHYNGRRYYDPRRGRYLTPDPIGLAGGINPYVYVENDPVNAVDPWGLFRLNFGANADPNQVAMVNSAIASLQGSIANNPQAIAYYNRFNYDILSALKDGQGPEISIGTLRGHSHTTGMNGFALDNKSWINTRHLQHTLVHETAHTAWFSDPCSKQPDISDIKLDKKYRGREHWPAGDEGYAAEVVVFGAVLD